MSEHGPHDWTGEGHACTTCSSSYHCPHCGDGCGSQGHLVKDADDWFLWCQEPERAERRRADLRAAMGRAS